MAKDHKDADGKKADGKKADATQPDTLDRRWNGAYPELQEKVADALQGAEAALKNGKGDPVLVTVAGKLKAAQTVLSGGKAMHHSGKNEAAKFTPKP